MASLLNISVVAPPDMVNIDIDFYDDTEKYALQAGKLGEAFKELPRTVEVGTAELCTYYLYYKLRPDVFDYSSHRRVAKRWHEALAEFNGQIGFGETSIHAVSDTGLPAGTAERIGEAMGLSVSSELHGLHGGDWQRIAIGKEKSADFAHSLASNSVNLIHVETKGSVAERDAIHTKSSSISAHKRSIKDKKEVVIPKLKSTGVMYGTIGVLPSRPNETARCWLVDPPAISTADPHQYRILSRLNYIAGLIRFLASRSHLAASLQTRLAALNAVDEIGVLNGVPLLRGNGERYDASTYLMTRKHNPWFNTRSVVSDGPAGGNVYLVAPNTLIFIGIREELIALATQQNFSEIADYGFQGGIVDKVVQCVIPVGRFKIEFAKRSELSHLEIRQYSGYVMFQAEFRLLYSRGGLVYGIASLLD